MSALCPTYACGEPLTWAVGGVRVGVVTSNQPARIAAAPYLSTGWRLYMVALVALVLILAIFGGLGFAVHVLWYVLIAALLLWLIGFFIGGVPAGGGRRWYGRW
jgi:hypothetical protein